MELGWREYTEEMKLPHLTDGESLGFLREFFSGNEPFTLSSGETVQVLKCSLTFKKWNGTPLLHTFGGKAVLDVSGKPQFAELAIADFFERHGFSVRWVETYGRSGMPMFLTDWQDKPHKEQTDRPIENQQVMDTLKRIAAINGGSYSGCWDVVAWKDETLLFAESKRLKRDRLRESQRRWFEAGLKSSLTPDNFVVVEWDFAKP